MESIEGFSFVILSEKKISEEVAPPAPSTDVLSAEVRRSDLGNTAAEAQVPLGDAVIMSKSYQATERGTAQGMESGCEDCGAPANSVHSPTQNKAFL